MMKEVVVTCWEYITWQLFANTKIRWEIPFDLWQSGKILQGEKGTLLMQLCKGQTFFFYYYYYYFVVVGGGGGCHLTLIGLFFF
jgi:hypothetical protein